MRVLNDFRCGSCGHTHEEYLDNGITECSCPECGETSTRVLRPPKFHLDGTDPGFPGAWEKWAKDKERRVKRAQKVYADHGEKI